MSATITTAARRITRDINATHETISTYYDADGHVIETLSAGAWLTTYPVGAVARIDGRKGSRWGRITEAEVQARLDVAAQVGQIEGPDFGVALGHRLA